MTGKPWRPSIHEETKTDRDRRGEARDMRLGQSLRIDRSGRPMSEGDWAEASADREYVRVAKDTVGDVRVSTVWIGTDDRIFPGGGADPQIFETRVIGLDGRPGGSLEDPERRYATEEEALIGHRQMVAAVKKHLAEGGGS